MANEVYPALGCTEPISCAHAAAVAAVELSEPVERVVLRVDRGTYKNGAAVTVPRSGGRKGNLIAAVLGALVARPEAKLEILSHVTEEIRERGMQAAGEYMAYASEVIRDRRAKPEQDDLVSVLVHAEIDGEKLDDEALIQESLLILVGGDETTRHVITQGMEALIRHPAELAGKIC